MDEKVYTPEVIAENPFPGEPILIDSSSKASADGNYSPTVTRSRAFKKKVLANELLSTALNTRSRKILGEFSFAASGALQLGDFREGISGDLRLTPNGITARDLAGLTTFALDGTDGSAVFKGHVQAGSFVSGSDNGVTVGPEIGVNGADFTDIQEAIDFINDLGGGTVFIQVGTYVVNKNLTLYSNISIVGEDDDNTIIDFNNQSFAMQASGTFANPLTNIHIVNVQFINAIGFTIGSIYFSYVNDSSIEKCKFSNNWNSGSGAGVDILLNSNGCNRVSIINCRSLASGWLLAGGGNHLKIKENYSENSLAGGITTNNSGLAYSDISGNYINNPADDGIKLIDNSNHNFLSNNNITSMGGYGIKIQSGLQIIQGNNIDGIDAGLDLIYLSANVIDCIITGNVFYRNASGKSCVYLNANCDANQICVNQMYGSGIGVTIPSASCIKNIVTNNIFRGQTTDISDSGTGTVIANNATV